MSNAREKAAAAIVALAQRTESAGKKDAKSAKGAGWQPIPYGAASSRMHPAKLREAVELFEIAESLHAASAGFGYPRAMALETLGDWNAAIAAFEGMAGTYYDGMVATSVQRCEKKRAGTYDEAAELGLPPGFADAEPEDDAEPDAIQAAAIAAMQGKSADELLAGIEAYLHGKTGGKQTGEDDPLSEAAGHTALAFVECLLDRDYAGAHAMLHPGWKEMDQDALRDGFEEMFADDAEFPSVAHVQDVQTDMPGLAEGSVAWVYVTIASENAEAVTLVVARDGDVLCVRDVEYGRA
jgi:hypothetical protein